MFTESVKITLNEGLDALPLVVSDRQRQQFLEYLELLNHWNKTHNLTAVRDPIQQITRHILDSLAVIPYLGKIQSLADIGSGAGLPALMIAIIYPEMDIFAVESNKKKSAFIRQAALKLQLSKVKVISQRVEDWQPTSILDIVISRALASAEKFMTLTAHLGHEKTQWLIMKGREEEPFQVSGFNISARHKLNVPLLLEERTLLNIQRI